MVRLRGPLMSVKAQKQLGKTLIYKNKKGRNFLTKYNKPGGNRLFDPSPTQINKRMIYNLIIANWQVKSTAEKKVFNDLAKSKNLKMSGWNYFLREAMGDLPTYLGLQGYWSFNRIVGGQILDLSGNGNHGDLKPSYPSNAPTLVDSFKKKFGKAGSFDGIDDRVEMGDIFDVPIGSVISLSTWAKFNTDDNFNSPMGKSGLTGTSEWAIHIDRNKRIIIRAMGPNTGNDDRTTIIGPIVTVGKWYHIVGILDGSSGGEFGEAKLYIDGVEYTSYQGGVRYTGDERYRQPIENAKLFIIGGTNHPTYPSSDGIFDEVLVFNRALSIEEIQKHYQLKFT